MRGTHVIKIPRKVPRIGKRAGGLGIINHAKSQNKFFVGPIVFSSADNLVVTGQQFCTTL